MSLNCSTMPLYLDIGYEFFVFYGDMLMVWPFRLQVDLRAFT